MVYRFRIWWPGSLSEVPGRAVEMPAVPDLHDPILEYPDVLPAATGGSHPQLAENDIREREVAEIEKIFFISESDLLNIADMRAAPLYADNERYVSAKYHEICLGSPGTRDFYYIPKFFCNCPRFPDRLEGRSPRVIPIPPGACKCPVLVFPQ